MAMGVVEAPYKIVLPNHAMAISAAKTKWLPLPALAERSGIIFSHEVDAIRQMGTPPAKSKEEHCIRALHSFGRRHFSALLPELPPEKPNRNSSELQSLH